MWEIILMPKKVFLERHKEKENVNLWATFGWWACWSSDFDSSVSHCFGYANSLKSVVWRITLNWFIKQSIFN